MQTGPLIYALFGLAIGSFLNVCIYKIPLNKSIVSPGSGCPNCEARIPLYDKIPVLSFFVLLGKCRFCGNPISMQYPFVEFLTGLAFYACAKTWHFAAPTFVNSLFLSMLIVLIFIDYHHQILPNVITLPGTAAGILLSFFQEPRLYADYLSFRIAALFGLEHIHLTLPVVGSILGSVFWGGMLLVGAIAFQKIRKIQGLGMGDVKMMLMVGAFLGLRLGFITIFAGSLLGSLIGIGLMLWGRANMRTKLAFGVFLGIGAAFSLFYGISSIQWYWSIYQDFSWMLNERRKVSTVQFP